MRRLGLLGGMSWQSSVEYERIINETVRERLGGASSADLLIRSFNFSEIEQLQAEGNWAQAGVVLAEAAYDLESAGAEAIVICTNTMHRVADQVQAAVTVPSSTLPTPPLRPSRRRGSSASGSSAPATRWSRTSTRVA